MGNQGTISPMQGEEVVGSPSPASPIVDNPSLSFVFHLQTLFVPRFDRTMGGREISRRGLLFAVLLVSAAIPMAFATTSSSPKKESKSWGPPPQLVSELPVDAGVRVTSSAVFRIYGNVYPLGLYYVEMHIGKPPKPYFLDVDTGSDLTWLQCDAPCVRCSKGPHPWYRPNKKKLVNCKDPLCVALHSGVVQDQNCEQCDYEIQYEDRGSSLGVLIADSFAVRLTNSTVARPTLAFGCGYDQQVPNQDASASTDGILGLGTGKVSILSQLSDQGVTKNVVGHCLGGKGGGYLFFGDDLVPTSRMTWSPMSRIGSKNYYSPGPANLYWDNQYLGVKQTEVVLDTGSTFTYFGHQSYQAFLSAVKSDLSEKPLKEEADPSLPVCWKGQKPFKSVSDVKKYFKTLTFNFVNGKRALLEMLPQNYLIITKYGNACLGILNGTEVGLGNLNVIGDISLLDHMVVYDNEKQHIGWVRAACDRLPNVDSEDGGLYNDLSQYGSRGFLSKGWPSYDL
ncbi:aspartic proteinase Asp1-like isoform X1 [Zingiber officinale]|uniref:aspartic proteinase Asp1-like isoform X1 n=1 Tax=Zingiber officinale TaxID=94328 RepID=UPI001C4B1784|nr:aspartic proteinase Asp1-like isoform X1 [Zingiber officinale]